MRIVSLVPSMTETLLDWGIEPVACTRFCEQPDIPHMGGTKDPDVRAIRAATPDLVVMDAQENRREDFDALVSRGINVAALDIRSLGDLRGQLEPLAARLGVSWVMPDLPPPERQAESVFVPIWKRPWMALGTPTYGSSVLEHIGLRNVFAGETDTYPETSLADAAGRSPDIVLAPSEPYPFAERHRELLESVARTVFVDGRDLLWWGSRTSGALRRLIDLTARPGTGPG